jgi:hypothetical protein
MPGQSPIATNHYSPLLTNRLILNYGVCLLQKTNKHICPVPMISDKRQIAVCFSSSKSIYSHIMKLVSSAQVSRLIIGYLIKKYEVYRRMSEYTNQIC